MQFFNRTILRGLAVIAVLVAVGFVLKNWGIGGGILDEAWIDENIRQNGAGGATLFLVVGALFVAVGFPRQVVSFLAGYAFGLVGGTLIALGATAVGCIVTFTFARFVARGVIAKKFSGRIARADAFFGRNTFAATLLIRFLPIGNNFVTNLVAGVSKAGAVSFVTGSALGYFPQTLIFALLGSGISLEPELRISLAVVLFLLSAALGIYLYRRYRKESEPSSF
ncbi:MAG: TVP38/TMEM64 family protein [Rhodospirillales bacterium]|nr:TVP38/TMEM64 family protein [Rhodospirillales bacterium]